MRGDRAYTLLASLCPYETYEGVGRDNIGDLQGLRPNLACFKRLNLNEHSFIGFFHLTLFELSGPYLTDLSMKLRGPCIYVKRTCIYWTI